MLDSWHKEWVLRTGGLLACDSLVEMEGFFMLLMLGVEVLREPEIVLSPLLFALSLLLLML